MADCSKTVDFMRELNRMHKAFDECRNCPLSGWKREPRGLDCNEFVKHYTEQTISIVQKWSDEHPVMTWMSKLVEKFPNAEKISMITGACPGWVFGTGPNMHRTGCDGRRERRCEECWNGEYKEE